MTSPFTWSTTTPADTDIVAQYPALARARQATLGASSATGGVLGTLVPTTGGGTPTVGWRAVQDADELWAALNAWYNGTLWAQDNAAKESYAIHYSTSGAYLEILRMRAGQTTWETMLRIPDAGISGQIANYAKIIPVVSGTAVQYAVDGSDTNIDLNLVPKGAGIVRVLGGLRTQTTVYTSGSGTYTTPTGAYMLKVTMVGGGGGGSGLAGGNFIGGGGGGAGGTVLWYITSPSATYAYAVGGGGAGGVGNTSGGGTGGNTTFGTATASGGSGGQQNGVNGGAGGVTSGGTVGWAGGAGAQGQNVSSGGGGLGGTGLFGGAGGGGAGSNGGNAQAYTGAGGGGASGASSATNGGAGGSGIIIVEAYL